MKKKNRSQKSLKVSQMVEQNEQLQRQLKDMRRVYNENRKVVEQLNVRIQQSKPIMKRILNKFRAKQELYQVQVSKLKNIVESKNYIIQQYAKVNEIGCKFIHNTIHKPQHNFIHSNQTLSPNRRKGSSTYEKLTRKLNQNKFHLQSDNAYFQQPKKKEFINNVQLQLKQQIAKMAMLKQKTKKKEHSLQRLQKRSNGKQENLLQKFKAKKRQNFCKLREEIRNKRQIQKSISHKTFRTDPFFH